MNEPTEIEDPEPKIIQIIPTQKPLFASYRYFDAHGKMRRVLEECHCLALVEYDITVPEKGGKREVVGIFLDCESKFTMPQLDGFFEGYLKSDSQREAAATFGAAEVFGK